MLHERICRSQKLARVSFEAECCWYRLLVLTDDNGNIERDLDVIRSHGFVKRAVTNEQIDNWLRELTEVRSEGNGEHGLVAEYEVSGKRYLHIANFEEFQVIARGKYPHIECPPHPESLGRVLKDHGEPVMPGGWKERWAHVDSGRLLQGSAGECRGVQGSSENRNELNRIEKKRASAHPALRPASEFAFKTWESRFGRRPNWQAKDWSGVAGLFKRLPELTLAIFQRHWRNYLASTEGFIQKQGYGLAYFCSRFDGFAAGPVHDPKRPGERKSVEDELRILDARRVERKGLSGK